MTEWVRCGFDRQELPSATLRLMTNLLLTEFFCYNPDELHLSHNFVIPTGAQRSGGTCGFPAVYPTMRYSTSQSNDSRTAASDE
jgi:hypothetical protein